MNKENHCPNGDGDTNHLSSLEKKCVPKLVEIPVGAKRWCLDDFDLGKRIGKGHFASVYSAQEKKSKVPVAMKVMYKVKLKKEVLQDNLFREINIQGSLQRRHQGILPLYTFFHDETRVFLVLEYCIGGSLRQALSSACRFDAARTKHIFTQLANVLDFCHSQLVIHRDIKPDNILLGTNDTIKLADFGLAIIKKALDGSHPYTMCGTAPYLAPEIVRELPYNEKVDNWSLGVVLHEMLVGSLPFLGASKVMDTAIMNVDYYANYSCVDELAQDLISQFLQEKPNHRIELAQVPNHAWFQEGVRDPILN